MPPTPKLCAALAASCLLLALGAARPPSGSGPPERDFEAYYSAGITRNAGGDPYSRDIWRAERAIPGVNGARDELLPFVGPPAGLPFWSLLARLPYRAALVIWTTLLVSALIAILGAGLRLAHAPSDVWTVGTVLVLVVASAPMIGSLALGQAALIGAGALAAALLAYSARRPAAAVAATLIAAAQPNLTLVLVARMRTWWDAGIAAAAASVFAALALAANGGLGGIAAYLRVLAAHGRAERDVLIQHTPVAIAYALGLAPATALVTGTLIAAAAIVSAGVIIVRERLEPTSATFVAGAALPFAVPFFHEADFAIMELPLLVLALRARGRARSLAAVAAVLVLVDWLGLAQRPHAQAQIVCFGLALAFAFAALCPPGSRRGDPARWAGLIGLGLAVTLALPVGLTHPAPTWPDMLPAHYAAPVQASAAGVWGDEQRAAGLTGRDPGWALLRSFPLLGCVILIAAVVADARQRRRVPADSAVAKLVKQPARPRTQISTASMSSNGET